MKILCLYKQSMQTSFTLFVRSEKGSTVVKFKMSNIKMCLSGVLYLSVTSILCLYQVNRLYGIIVRQIMSWLGGRVMCLSGALYLSVDQHCIFFLSQVNRPNGLMVWQTMSWLLARVVCLSGAPYLPVDQHCILFLSQINRLYGLMVWQLVSWLDGRVMCLAWWSAISACGLVLYVSSLSRKNRLYDLIVQQIVSQHGIVVWVERHICWWTIIVFYVSLR